MSVIANETIVIFVESDISLSLGVMMKTGMFMMTIARARNHMKKMTVELTCGSTSRPSEKKQIHHK